MDSLMKSIAEKRRELVKKLFPSGIPRLWCPLLTYYTDDDSIDFDRMSAHLKFL
jgi:dihydrodipicolinate synthase/N-acetylneuraminate lyase